jgi:hypothetical protein
MYAVVLPANVTRQRDTSPMDSFNRTRYRPCPLNTYRLTGLRTFLSVMGMMLRWFSYANETDDCRANYENDCRGAISESYAPRCFPALWLTMEINIRSRSPVYKRLLETLFRVVGTKLNISKTYHPRTDGQIEQVSQTWE